ncbi:hypothetical protein ONE63_000927 [Megalurothrips usitatus]|uniref:SET domain-containing protein SmydA-8-like n=1 Tax=Megalurothrips usitatus TaxID=439358 RepID=A0AAV7Y601_9NEOP|nr:hypothetical protein ONE63_000927 [Megalurothrips usitatus]
MDPYSSEDGPCVVCSQPGRACAGCFSVYYCGKDHQLQHWQGGHKQTCAPYKISKDPVLGRFLEATQEIKAGTFIMKSKPLVHGPQMSSEPVCLSCCRRLANEPDEWYQCSGCGWPLCSEKCEAAKEHKPECCAMSKAGFYMGRDCGKITILGGLEELNQWSWYGSIMPIRALLLPPKDYKKMMTLQTHLQEHRRNPEFNFKVRSVTNFIHNTLKMRDFQEEDIATVLAIFDTNAFAVVREDLNQVGRALYYMGSMMAHACRPNARLCHVGEKFEMALMAEQNIPLGASINITYMDRLNGTLKRLTHLRTTKYFDCSCPRCSDPSDMGLYLDSFRCTKCRGSGKDSLLLSTNSIKLTAEWKCQNPACSNTLSAADMIRLHKDLRNTVTNLEDSTQLSDHRDFMEKQLGSSGLLHSTSTYILRTKIFIIFNILGHSSGYMLKEMTQELLSYKIQLCEEMLQIARILHPGYSKTRAFLLVQLQESIMEQVYRNVKNKCLTLEDAQESAKKVKAGLDEAASILREPARKIEMGTRLTKFQHQCKHLGLSI